MDLEKNSCIKCGKPPVFFRKQAGHYFCKECFIESIERIIHKTISSYKMLNPHDKIVVAYSGGISSTILLYNINKIQKRIYGAKPIKALTLLKENDEILVKHTNNFCKEHSIKHIIRSISLKGDFKNKLNINFYYYLVQNALEDIDASVICLGINLTDIAELCFLEILEGTNKLETRFKMAYPLMRIPENELYLYSKLKGFRAKLYSKKSITNFPLIREFIEDTVNYSPEIEYNLFSVYHYLLKIGFIN